jgi:Secretion system C-terminal sorting domain
LEWQKALGGSATDQGTEVVETADGGFALIGHGGSGDGDVTGHFGLFDYWVTMLDGFGNLKWEKSLGGTNADWGEAIVATGDGGVIAAGTTRSSDGDVQNNDGGSEFWLVKLNRHGQLVWEKTYGGSGPEVCYTFSKTSDGGLVAAGYSWSSDGDVSGTTNMGKADVWIVKLGSETVGLEDLTEYPAYPLELYPNPAGDEITLNVEGGHSNVQLTLRDLRGAQVLQETASGFATVSIAHLKPGVYFATAVSSDGKVYCKKFEKL